ncbi:hypothetical protein U1Q18_025513, partial [Sarracenia purpurea var. burkii]
MAMVFLCSWLAAHRSSLFLKACWEFCCVFDVSPKCISMVGLSLGVVCFVEGLQHGVFNLGWASPGS